MPKALVFALPSTLLSIGFHYFFKWYGTVPDHLSSGTSLWASFTFVLGVLIVFRTNQAYSRYWEGATLLLQVRGEWLNAASSLVAFCTRDPALREDVLKFQHQLVRLMSLTYCAALQQVALVSDEDMEIIDMTGLNEESLKFLVATEERCDVLLQWIRRLIVQNMSSGVIPVPPPILTRVFQELSRGLVDAKDVQKIAEFPFPFPYTQLILVMLMIQTVLTPIIAAVSGDDPIWAACVTLSSVLALWSMNYTAAELEQPFGEDFNDLPICDMMKEMNLRLGALLDEKVKVPPDFHCTDVDSLVVRTTSCSESGYFRTRRHVEGFSKARSRELVHQRSAEPPYPWMINNSMRMSMSSPAHIFSESESSSNFQMQQLSPLATIAATRSDPGLGCARPGDASPQRMAAGWPFVKSRTMAVGARRSMSAVSIPGISQELAPLERFAKIPPQERGDIEQPSANFPRHCSDPMGCKRPPMAPLLPILGRPDLRKNLSAESMANSPSILGRRLSNDSAGSMARSMGSYKQMAEFADEMDVGGMSEADSITYGSPQSRSDLHPIEEEPHESPRPGGGDRLETSPSSVPLSTWRGSAHCVVAM